MTRVLVIKSVAPIAHLRTCVMKFILIQDESPNGKIVERILSFKRSHENHCLFQLSLFNERIDTLINKYTCMGGETVFQ